MGWRFNRYTTERVLGVRRNGPSRAMVILMKIFADTSKVDEIHEFVSWGVIDGVTTNPKIIADDKNELEPTIRAIAKLTSGPISVEVTTNELEGMISEAKKYAAWAPNIVVKLPIGPTGLKACAQLTKMGIKTNVTACMNMDQAVLAAKAGATFVSLFWGRIGDLGFDPAIVVSETADIFEQGEFKSEIIVGSIRSMYDVHRAISSGAHIVTVPPKFLKMMAYNPQSEKTIDEFLKAWESIKK